MSQVRQLYQLQLIDSEIAEKKSRLQDVLRAKKADEAVKTAQQQATAAAQELRQWSSSQRNLELELAGLSAKSASSEQRMYSGNIKNPKELEDLQHELESLGRRAGALEDETLKAMLMVEEAERAFEQADGVREQEEAAWATRLQLLQTEQLKLATRLNELLATREEQVGRISPEMLATYQAAKKRGVGVAVATLSEGRCQACKVTVPTRKGKAVEEGRLEHCGSCGRILSMP